MHYIIHCLDRPGAAHLRVARTDAHKAYVAAATIWTVISGPLLADDNQTMIGSCFLVEAETLADVKAFNAGDPFRTADL
jgi:uncharacterized protein